ncbi:MAG: hypothetical protein ACLFV2_11515 [Desulfurivibrionaceae bacterium]
MNNDKTGLRVECYAGYKGEETPRRLYLGNREIDVVEVLDRWLDPDHRYFKLRGSDGDIYLIRHDIPTGLWQITLYESGRLKYDGKWKPGQ